IATKSAFRRSFAHCIAARRGVGVRPCRCGQRSCTTRRNNNGLVGRFPVCQGVCFARTAFTITGKNLVRLAASDAHFLSRRRVCVLRPSSTRLSRGSHSCQGDAACCGGGRNPLDRNNSECCGQRIFLIKRDTVCPLYGSTGGASI